jgi:hypothetical protein
VKPLTIDPTDIPLPERPADTLADRLARLRRDGPPAPPTELASLGPLVLNPGYRRPAISNRVEPISPNTELLASIADAIHVSARSHSTDLLIAARDEIARLNSEVVRLQAQCSVQKRRVPLSAEERRVLGQCLRLGTRLDAVELHRIKVGKLVEKLEEVRS